MCVINCVMGYCCCWWYCQFNSYKQTSKPYGIPATNKIQQCSSPVRQSIPSVDNYMLLCCVLITALSIHSPVIIYGIIVSLVWLQQLMTTAVSNPLCAQTRSCWWWWSVSYGHPVVLCLHNIPPVVIEALIMMHIQYPYYYLWCNMSASELYLNYAQHQQL